MITALGERRADGSHSPQGSASVCFQKEHLEPSTPSLWTWAPFSPRVSVIAAPGGGSPCPWLSDCARACRGIGAVLKLGLEIEYGRLGTQTSEQSPVYCRFLCEYLLWEFPACLSRRVQSGCACSLRGSCPGSTVPASGVRSGLVDESKTCCECHSSN